jgi:hypothetical protein
MNDFWQNVSRYPRYLITIVLGIFFALYQWLKPLAKKPVTLVALVLLLVSGFVFVSLTLRAMLGLDTVTM